VRYRKLNGVNVALLSVTFFAKHAKKPPSKTSTVSRTLGEIRMNDILTQWIIPILIYSGPLFTWGAVLKMQPSKKESRRFKILVLVHLAAFIPFLISITLQHPDSLHALTLPALTGFIMFSSGVIYFAYVLFKSNKNSA